MAILLSIFVMIFILRGTRAQTVTQPEDHLSVFTGDPVQVKCNYSYSGSPVLFWYVQYPKQGLQLLLKHISGGSVKGFTASLNQGEMSFHLKKPSAQEEDSAMYYCVLGSPLGSRGKFIFGQGTSLQVKPAIQNPDPAVYQLKSPESSNISVCLFTDFDSEVNVNPSTESNMIRLKSTSLDMKTMDSKSNGALAWSNSFDLGCNSTFNYTFHSSSEFPCDANVVEKGFETDMNLNFDNLTVIMFRIIFLKAVGFNLLMTLKLWSS